MSCTLSIFVITWQRKKRKHIAVHMGEILRFVVRALMFCKKHYTCRTIAQKIMLGFLLCLLRRLINLKSRPCIIEECQKFQKSAVFKIIPLNFFHVTKRAPSKQWNYSSYPSSYLSEIVSIVLLTPSLSNSNAVKCFGRKNFVWLNFVLLILSLFYS